MIKKFFFFIPWIIGKLLSYIYSYKTNSIIQKISVKFYSSWISNEFKSFGKNTFLLKETYLIGGKYISLGNRTCIGNRAILTAWDKYGTKVFHPEIIIGNNVSIGDDCHISAINKIVIGNDVLTGKKITIVDNSHGECNLEGLAFSPLDRPLYSAGPVYIEDGVWIGDKVTILPNVRIGKNAIIGANAVVSKDIPANCIAVGIPAKVIKFME